MKYLSGFAGLILLMGFAGGAVAGAQQQPWSVRAANAAMQKWPGGVFSLSGAAPAGARGQGLLLNGLEAVWKNTVHRPYFLYIEHSVNPLVLTQGRLVWPYTDGNEPDESAVGQPLMLLFGESLNKRYYESATALYEQLENQPPEKNDFGEAEPFLAAYALKFHHSEEFAPIAEQFRAIQGKLFGDAVDGTHQGNQRRERLLGRARYMAALVDTIPSVRGDSNARRELISILNQDAAKIASSQNSSTGLWAQRAGGSSTAMRSDAAPSCLFMYALAKGVRLGYLPESYDTVAERAYQGVLTHFVTGGADGSFALHGTLNSPLEMGAFILASTEIENVKNAKIGRGDNVMVDGWFNSQKRTDPTGREIYFHYKWDEESNPGYSLWGHAFRNFGARTTTLYAEPTFENLRPAQVYIIASPDNLDKNPQAHFANATDAKEIAKWVEAGGVLAIMQNDTSFADLDHFNVVAEKFGIHFNSTLRMHVVGTDWAMGRFYIDGKGPIFHHPHTAYVKDVCTISVKPPAVPVYKHEKDIFMAVAKYGKGTVYAMVDPWFYNEYTNGLKLPAKYDNYAAGVELARWLLEQVPRGAR
jgi:unsaturated rhamnogalacturonyl hydrolase